MSHYIPRLARISAGKGASAKHVPIHGTHAPEAAVNVERLARLLPQIRHRLAVGHQLSDKALLASLAAIARQPTHEARWRAAEASTLGQHLAVGGRDMHRMLVTLLSMLPPPSL